MRLSGPLRSQDLPGGPTRSGLDTGPFGMDAEGRGRRPGRTNAAFTGVFFKVREVSLGCLKENWKELWSGRWWVTEVSVTSGCVVRGTSVM